MTPGSIHLGCGNDVRFGWRNWDLIGGQGIEEVNLAVKPWPVADRSVGRYEARHVFEHFDGKGLRIAMEEIQRTLYPNGEALIVVPFYRCLDMLSDPTHVTSFELRTWDAIAVWVPDLSLEVSLKVQPPLLVTSESGERFYGYRLWSILGGIADIETLALDYLVVKKGLRALQTVIPPWLRCEWEVRITRR